MPLPCSRPALSSARRGRGHDGLKAGVVVGSVVTHVGLGRLDAAADNAPRAAAARTGGFHGVLTVIAPTGGGQQSLAVAEYGAVLVIGERATLVDQAVGGAGLLGQIGQRNGCKMGRGQSLWLYDGLFMGPGRRQQRGQPESQGGSQRQRGATDTMAGLG